MSTRRAHPLVRSLASLGFAASLALTGGCDEAEQDGDDHGHEDEGHDDHGHDDHDHNHETEVFTTVRLTFTPKDGGDRIVASFTDPDGDGGVSGSSDPVALALGVTYDLELEFFNELEEPIEDVTLEVQEEAEEHFAFIRGDTVQGPATGDNPDALMEHAYADTEEDYGPNNVGENLPVGLLNTVTAQQAGAGTFSVMLRHLPDLNGSPQKTADLPDLMARGEALPGEVDVDVEFQLTVQ